MYELIKSKIFRPRQPWEKNLLVLWFGTFMAGIGFSLVMPFMPLYINTLGTFTHQQLNFWSGITFSSTFLVTTIVSPWWGRLADRKGRKLMLLRASLGMAIVISLMGAVTSVYQLIGLRLLQGVFSGYISNATALVATGTPKEKSGQVLGTLATGSVTGTLLGPLLGGVTASIPGIATLIAAPRFGRLGDRIGSERILTIGLILAIFVYLPMAFVQNVWQLAMLRFLVGISDACLLPAVQTLITRYSPSDAAGRIFSYNQSFQATGNVIGPMIGSSVSAAFGYRGVFISTSCLVLINLLWVRRSTAELKKEKNDD